MPLLQEHLASLQRLQQLITSVVDCGSHPNAINGKQLQSAGTAADITEADSGHSTDTNLQSPVGIDIVQLLQVS